MKNTDLFAIITGTNNKGGVGKTVSSVNLAVTTASMGYPTLYVDGDSQENGTKALGVRERDDPSRYSLLNAFKNKLSYQDVVVKSPYKNLDVIAATPELEEESEKFLSSPRRFSLFRQLLVGAESKYNFVFLDTPPIRGGVLTPAAIAASHYYIIPSFADSDSYDGFVKIVKLCEEIREAENEKLSCLGVFITCLKRNRASQVYLDYVIPLLKEANMPVFPQCIAQSDTVDTARLMGKPAVTLPNATAIRESYIENARYLIARIKEHKKGKYFAPDLSKLGLIKDNVPLEHNKEIVVKKSNRLELQF